MVVCEVCNSLIGIQVFSNSKLLTKTATKLNLKLRGFDNFCRNHFRNLAYIQISNSRMDRCRNKAWWVAHKRLLKWIYFNGLLWKNAKVKHRNFTSFISKIWNGKHEYMIVEILYSCTYNIVHIISLLSFSFEMSFCRNRQ